MMNWLREFWTRLVFLFKPTYHVFSSFQGALDRLPARGGTLLVNGEFFVGPDGISIPDKDVRIIGANFRMTPKSPGIIVAHNRRVIFDGCSFIGTDSGSLITVPPKQILE